MKHAKIVATGGYLPEKILTNKDLESMVDTTDEWIVDRTGISRRHMAGDHEDVATMAIDASKQALETAAWEPSSLDLIVVATSTAAKFFPSNACQIQEAMETGPCIAFDVGAACSGFIYALSVAQQFIESGKVRRALVVGSEVMSRGVNWEDRGTCILFGDGAGCVLLESSDEPGVLSTHLYADGKYAKLLYMDYPQFSAPASEHYPYIFMDGNKVFKLAVNALEQVVVDTLEKHNLNDSDVDWLVPHQANMRIIKATAKKLGMPMEKVICTVNDQGNTSAASIPLALNIGVRDGRIKRGQTLFLESFGAGLTWGSALVKY